MARGQLLPLAPTLESSLVIKSINNDDHVGGSHKTNVVLIASFDVIAIVRGLLAATGVQDGTSRQSRRPAGRLNDK